MGRSADMSQRERCIELGGVKIPICGELLQFALPHDGADAVCDSHQILGARSCECCTRQDLLFVVHSHMSDLKSDYSLRYM